jgi:Flp pilus assembly protein CpaB
LPPREAAALIEPLARAIHHAHQRGIVHRDLKPGNVLLTGDGVPKVTDFGLAKQLDLSGAHTRSGSVLGTPSYMAPEQAAGRTKDIGPATDVYGLGAILYECLTGRPPFKAETPVATAAEVLTREPVAPGQLRPDVPADLEAICTRCLQKEIGRRYPSADALADDLRRFLAGEPTVARSARPPRRKPRRTDRWLAAALVLFILWVIVPLLVIRWLPEQFWGESGSDSPTIKPRETVTVLVADRDVAQGTFLEDPELFFHPIKFFKGEEPHDAIRDIAALKGRIVMAPRLRAGDPIQQGQLLSPKGSFPVKVPPGLTASTIAADSLTTPLGLVQQDSRVDVLWISQILDGKTPRADIKIKNLLVLAVNYELDRSTTGNTTRKFTITLAVTDQQAKDLAYYEATGRIQLLLRRSAGR